MYKLLGIAVLVGGCGGSVVTPSHPEVSSSRNPVAIGTALRVNTTWEGRCEESVGFTGVMLGAYWGGGEHAGPPTTPCHEVAYDAIVTCEDNACDWKTVGRGAFEVIPKRVGTLRAHVRFDPRGRGTPKTVDLAPIVVETPTSATVTCDLGGDHVAQLDLEVRGTSSVLEHDARVRVVGGGECTRNEVRYPYSLTGAWTCPIDALHPRIELVGTGFTLPVEISCNLVFEPPNGSVPRKADHYAFNKESPIANCTGDLAIETKRGFETFGWSVDQVTDQGVVATRLGKTATVRFGEWPRDDSGDRRVCTWDLTTDAPSLISTNEIRARSR